MSSNESNTKDKVLDPTIPEHDLCMEWSVRIWGRTEEIVNIRDARITFPLALHPDFKGAIPDFSHLFEILVVKPVLSALRRREILGFNEEMRRVEQGMNTERGEQQQAAPVFWPEGESTLAQASSQEPVRDQRFSDDMAPSPSGEAEELKHRKVA